MIVLGRNAQVAGGVIVLIMVGLLQKAVYGDVLELVKQVTIGGNIYILV